MKIYACAKAEKVQKMMTINISQIIDRKKISFHF